MDLWWMVKCTVEWIGCCVTKTWTDFSRNFPVSAPQGLNVHDIQFSCAINQPLLAHHWMAHQCLLTSRFVAPSIPWRVSALVARWGSSFLRTITFLIIHRFLSLKVLLLIYCFSKSTAYNTFQFEKLFWIWWRVLDTIILWQYVGPCCEQTNAAFEVGLSLDQGQGVYSGWSDVVGSSQLRLCHMCILHVMSVFFLILNVYASQWVFPNIDGPVKYNRATISYFSLLGLPNLVLCSYYMKCFPGGNCCIGRDSMWSP